MTIRADDLSANEANWMPLDPASFLERAAAAYPDQIAVIDGDRQFTYAELYERCRRLASALRRAGVGPGDVVSLMATNTPQGLEAHFGVMMAGAVLNPLNIRLDASLLTFILDHAETKLLLTDTEYAPVIADVLAACRTAPTVVDIVDDQRGSEHRRLGAVDYDAFLATGDADAECPGIGDERQPIFLTYTSGTTGDPKGVVSSARQVYLNSLGLTTMWALPRHPRYLWTLPMFHAMGWCTPYAMVVMAGTQICLRRVDPVEIRRLIERHDVTHFCAAPVVLDGLLAHDDRRPASTIHVLTAGSAPPRRTLVRARASGYDVLHVYGMTESGGVQTHAPTEPEMDDDEFAALSVRQGVAIATLQGGVIVADPDTCAPVAQDGIAIGEVMYRGNTVMSGYLKNPAATRDVFHGGWLHSGDLAVWHPGGQVDIKDRSKDIIISGGENISSLEVEGVLLEHPDIVDAAVVAGPHERWGETPVAYITTTNDLDPIDVIGHCRARLAHFKCPTRVVFTTLPRTATGKVQKYLLRQWAHTEPIPETT